MAARPTSDGAARASFMLKKEAPRRARYKAGDHEALESLAEDAVAGKADLLEAIDYKAVDLDKLEEDKLPDELRKLNKEERKAYVEKKLAERKELEAKLLDLTRQRDAYLIAEREKNKGKKDGFDEQVGKFIREQAKKKGIVYEE